MDNDEKITVRELYKQAKAKGMLDAPIAMDVGFYDVFVQEIAFDEEFVVLL